MEGGNDSKLPIDIFVSNLGENAWGNAAKKLAEDLKTVNKEKYTQRLGILQQKHEESLKEYRNHKRMFAQSMCEHQKRLSINANTGDAPRTNAWTVGDYVRIRAPEPKKRKKKAQAKRQTIIEKNKIFCF